MLKTIILPLSKGAMFCELNEPKNSDDGKSYLKHCHEVRENHEFQYRRLGSSGGGGRGGGKSNEIIILQPPPSTSKNQSLQAFILQLPGEVQANQWEEQLKKYREKFDSNAKALVNPIGADQSRDFPMRGELHKITNLRNMTFFGSRPKGPMSCWK